MTTSRRRTSRRSSRSGRNTPFTWWNESSANNLLGTGVSARVSLVDPANASLPATFEAGLTVVRAILRVVIRSNVATQFNTGNFGLAVRTGTAVIDVILSLLDYYLLSSWETNTSSAADKSQDWVKDYDIRTARKLRGKDRHLDFMITNNSASAGSIRWAVHARFLLRP